MSEYRPNEVFGSTQYELHSIIAKEMTEPPSYCAFIRPGKNDLKWYKFSDEIVTPAIAGDVFNISFGRYDYEPQDVIATGLQSRLNSSSALQTTTTSEAMVRVPRSRRTKFSRVGLRTVFSRINLRRRTTSALLELQADKSDDSVNENTTVNPDKSDASPTPDTVGIIPPATFATELLYLRKDTIEDLLAPIVLNDVSNYVWRRLVEGFTSGRM